MIRKILTTIIFSSICIWSNLCFSNSEWQDNNYNEIIIISSNQPVFSETLSHRLNLTQQQKTSIQKTAEIAQQHLDSIQLAMKHNAYNINQTFSNHFNASQLKTLTEKQGKLYAESIQTKLIAKHHIMTLLTPEQRQKINILKSLARS